MMAKNSQRINFFNEHFVPVFQKQPFLHLFIYLAVGVLIGNFFCDNELVINSFLTGVFSYLCYLNVSKTWKKIFLHLSIAFSFIFVGLLSQYHFHNSYFQLKDVQNQNSFQMKIIEFQPKTNGWSKGIGEIKLLNNQKNKDKVERIVFYSKPNKSFDVNDFLLLNTSLIPIENKGNPGEFDLKMFWKGKGIRYMCFFDETNFKLLDRKERNPIQHFFYWLQCSFNQILEYHLEGENLAIGKALILGDKSMLDSETKNSFSATGAMHVLAVSGLHIGLILQILLVVAKGFSKFISRKTAIIVIVIMLWIYSILTGFSPSVIRSIFMFTILIFAQFSGKTQNNINSLFFSAFVLLLIEPMFLFDIGFQLSYLAMIGIFTLYKPIEKWYQPKNKILKYFWQGTAVGFAAQCMTVPLTLYYFHQFPNYFALANLGLMLVSGAVLGLGIAVFVLHYLPIIGKITGYLLMLSIAIMLWFIQWVEHLPGAVAYGFNIPFILVPIISFVLFFLIKLRTNQLIWKIFAVLFIVFLYIVVANRWESLNKSHICILNQNTLTVLLKQNNKILCFYNDAPENIEKVKFSAEAYLKSFPGEISYYSLKSKNYNLSLKRKYLTIKKVDWDFLIEMNHKKLHIIHSEKSNLTKVKDVERIYMPWIENSKSIFNGAMFFPIE